MATDSVIRKEPKVLAFFGSDLNRRGERFLRKKFREGYVLLTLDAPAMRLASRAKLPYTVIDDWIDPSSLSTIIQENARYCELHWFESARQELTAYGICWPEFDREAMYWIWLNIMLAEKFSEVFTCLEGQQLVCFQNPVLRPGVYYYPSDICSSVWQAGLKKKVTVLSILPEQEKQESRIKIFWQRAYQYIRVTLLRGIIKTKIVLGIFEPPSPPKSEPDHPSVLKDKIVLAFNPGEFHRFTPVIHSLLDSDDDVAAIVLSSNREQAIWMSRAWSIPVVNGFIQENMCSELNKKFLDGYSRARRLSAGKPWQKYLEGLDYHFKYYCQQRWPFLAAQFRFLGELFKQWRPKAVIVSALFDAESQVPAIAARQCNVPSFSIPHGGGVKPVKLPSTYSLYSLKTQRSIYERAGVPATCLLPCAGLFVKDEHPVAPIQHVSNGRKWQVLVLTTTMGYPDYIVPLNWPRCQLKALQGLNTPPSDIAEQLQLFIKVHPGHPDLELYSAISKQLEKQVLPIKSDLHSLLKHFNLVVSVNYCGSGIIHAIQAGKAVIHFWSDPYHPGTKIYEESLFASGVLARASEDMWEYVRDYFVNRTFADNLHSKARQFSAHELDDRNYPRIAEVIDRTLSASSQQSF